MCAHTHSLTHTVSHTLVCNPFEQEVQATVVSFASKGLTKLWGTHGVLSA